MWFRDFGEGAANYDANGHFARVQPMFNAFSFTDNPARAACSPRIRPASASPGSRPPTARCPGAASQAPADGSAPFRDASGTLDCDPSQVPPGP